jgi:hypothetical protein
LKKKKLSTTTAAAGADLRVREEPHQINSFTGNDSCGEGREKRRDGPLEEAATKQATAKGAK